MNISLIVILYFDTIHLYRPAMFIEKPQDSWPASNTNTLLLLRQDAHCNRQASPGTQIGLIWRQGLSTFPPDVRSQATENAMEQTSSAAEHWQSFGSYSLGFQPVTVNPSSSRNSSVSLYKLLFFSSSSTTTWSRLTHPEEGRSTFHRNDKTYLYYVV